MKTDKNIRLYTFFIISMYFLKTSIDLFKYYPILDDYIQFISYHFYDDKLNNLIIKGGLCSVRPLAAIFDIYLWSNFWNNLNIIYFFICILHLASYLLFDNVFRKYKIKTGIFFAAFYLFLPLMTETNYWLSASTRIIIPLFLTAMCIFLIEKNNKLWIALNLASYCFYEQILVMSFIITIIILYKNNKKMCVIPILNVLVIGLWYLFFSTTGINAMRSIATFDFSKITYIFKYFFEMWFEILPQFLYIGIKNLFLYNYFIIILGLCIFFVLKFEINLSEGLAKQDFLMPVLIIVLPYIPFIFLKNTFLGLRNCVPMVFGFGMLMDLISSKFAKRCLAPIIIAVSIFSYHHSVSDYKKVYEADQIILNYVIENNVTIIEQHPLYVDVIPQYGEYIKNLTSSDWALTGAVRGVTQNPSFKMIEVK